MNLRMRGSWSTLRLQALDSIAHPIPTNPPGGSTSSYLLLPDEDLATAKSMVRFELASLIGFPTVTKVQVKGCLQTLSKNEDVDDSLMGT